MSQWHAASSKSSSACARSREQPPGCRGVDDSLQAWKTCSSMIAEFKLQPSNIRYIWTFRNWDLNILERLHGHLPCSFILDLFYVWMFCLTGCLCARRGQQMPPEMVVSHHRVLVENLTQVLGASVPHCWAVSPAPSQVLSTTTTSKKSDSSYLENQGKSPERGGKEVFVVSKIQM